MAYAFLTVALYAATVASSPIAASPGLGSLPGGLGGSTGGFTGTGSFPGLPGGGSSGTSPFPGFPSGGFGGSTGTGSSPSLPSGGFGGVGGTGSSGLGGAGGIFTPVHSNGFAERQSAGASSTANGASGPCMPVTVLYARGTSELGNIGSSVGLSLMSDLNTLFPNKVAFQGVNYSADVAGDEQLGKPGGTAATSQANGIISACPSTKLFISGYSEGAMVAHNAVAGLSTANKAKVTGVLVFGDPFDGQTISGYPESQVKTFCAQGDAVCQGSISISAAHLSYPGPDTQAGVQWIQQLAGL